jgi:hypothetical protein
MVFSSGSMRRWRMRDTKMLLASTRQKITCCPLSIRRNPGRYVRRAAPGPAYSQVGGNKLPAHRRSGQSVLVPTYLRCRSQYLLNLLRRGGTDDRYPSQALTLGPGNAKFPPDTLEWIAFSNSTGVSLINHCSKSRELCVKLLFRALQYSQSRSYDLTGIFIPATLDLGQDEAVEFICQVHVSSGHDHPFQSSMVGK